MKRIKHIGLPILIAAAMATATGCKKFLNVNPPTALSGNNFWKSASDFDQYILGIYNQFRTKTMGVGGVNNVQFFPCSGDFRCAPIIGLNIAGDRQYINICANNDMRTLTGSYTAWGDTFVKNTDWADFFKMIAGCNIMVDAINQYGSVLNASQRGQYMGEAVFMRNLIYFIMARLYGDIPYYTDAYNSTPQSRRNMVTVLKNCLADLRTAVNGMPWTYEDPSKRGNRAMKGSALNLMMNINMWCAGFDDVNATNYWQQTDSLGDVLLNQNGGVYALLPMEEFHEVFKGGSAESLFEITQSLNKGENFGSFSTFVDNVIAQPYKQNNQGFRPYMSYTDQFITQLYPPGKPDLRWTLMFYQSDPGDPATRQYLKFLNFYASAGEDVNPDDAQLIFRLPDAILLRAEALANLGTSDATKNDLAITLLNSVRARARATPYADGETPGLNLLDAIFYERCKELMGESYYFFDLVRTKRILNPKFCAHPISLNDFQLGAWTWPISSNALVKNPGMTVNTFWTQ